jgi:glycosyltransferase involved in cell wall biosynthesis
MNTASICHREPIRWFKKVLRKSFQKLSADDIHNRSPITLKTRKKRKGEILFAYLIEPFLMRGGSLDALLNKHTNFAESIIISKVFLEMGYDVDVISYRNKAYVPQKPYAAFFSARSNFQRIAESLNADCKKIFHIETGHWLFNNSQAYNRYIELQKRKGVTLQTRKIFKENWAIEYADCATMLGNNFTESTYAYANKKIYALPVPSVSTYAWNPEKDFQACRKRYLWFGSEALVNKGLDLVLEAFARLPDYELVVCGPIQQEHDFCMAYYRELYQTANIKTVGWVDVTGQQFEDIRNSCIGLIYPSCSEGQSGAVITCLQAGLIPVISYESGVDVDRFGLILKENTVDGVKAGVEEISNSPIEKLTEMSLLAWTYAQQTHTREYYTLALKNVLEEILAT